MLRVLLRMWQAQISGSKEILQGVLKLMLPEDFGSLRESIAWDPCPTSL